MKTFYSAGWRL